VSKEILATIGIIEFFCAWSFFVDRLLDNEFGVYDFENVERWVERNYYLKDKLIV
jgi:hypothetical protein